jgi:hypothetical protein
MSLIRIILRAGDIPLGSTVTKRGGKVKYILVDKIKIYDPDLSKYVKAEGRRKDVHEISADGCRFLIGSSNRYGTQYNVNSISEKTELAWILEEEELYWHLDKKLNLKGTNDVK